MYVARVMVEYYSIQVYFAWFIGKEPKIVFFLLLLDFDYTLVNFHFNAHTCCLLYILPQRVVQTCYIHKLDTASTLFNQILHLDSNYTSHC